MADQQPQPVAIVTGGTKGIGRSIALELSRTGYAVIVSYHSDDTAAEETARMLQQEGGSGKAMKFDVTDPQASEAAVAEIADRYGRIDVLVNNAGMIADDLFVMMSEKSWDAVIQTTLKGFFNMTQPVLKKMIAAKQGAVVSISSVSALVGNRGQANYAAAKAGLNAASRSIASEVARLGIRLNVVAPGLIDTEMIKDLPLDNVKQMIPMARIGRPEEVARVVRFLCSEDASYITGQVISVNGGMF
ncbi:MAG: 3-ketoacyl-ACP reductase [Deltaproteobacteria bacterium SG8_13]|nr:MAG: 3-ketoacyl-ACP reductase [Deltaproteobacteria bacterium SG8_13]